MKTNNLIGQRVVRVQQSVRKTGRPFNEKCNVVDFIELENGVRLIPMTIETEVGEYFHDFSVYSPKGSLSR